MQVSQAVDEYRYSVLGLSQKYQTWTIQKLEVFAAWCQTQQLELEDIRPKQFQQFLHEIRITPSEKTGKLLSSYTVHGYAQVVKVFLNWAGQQEDYEEQITERRVNGMKLPRVDQKIIETFSPDQIKLLLDACKKDRYPDLRLRNRLMIMLMLDTGIRLGELRGLKVENVHLDPRDPYIKVFGKGRKERTIPLGATVTNELQSFLRSHRVKSEYPNVFLTRSGAPLGYKGIEEMIARLCARCGITGVRASPHTFRHTFAVNYVRKTHDVYTLSKLLGHTAVSTTELYLKGFRDEDTRKNRASLVDDL